ncbi:MAG TPA: anthranilate phosphoribosyltransferase [Gemmatimonadaceae bacterium]|nr:anthranilate phosphoribosyltransferase [Gemmatimonadaceae bacterium]
MSTSSAPAPNPLLGTIRRLTLGEAPVPEELTEAFNLILAGDATPAQVAGLLVGLRVKGGGETPIELAAVVRSFREAMVSLSADRPDDLVDTCGTGGGSINTFNISTAAALLVAGVGVRVAKHGNRSFTTQCGSADVLEALGVSIDVPVPVMESALRDAGIVFMFAPLMHPAMRHVGPVRRELGVQTIMNLVGPLANPARAGRQVVGVSDPRRLPLIAGALAELNSVHALVVHGEGMDEISPFVPTQVIEVSRGTVRSWEIDPRRFGYGAGTAEDVAGGPPAANAAAIMRVLRAEGNATATAAVVLNAAAALYVAGRAVTYDDAVEQAKAAIDSGAGIVALDRLRVAFART